MLFKYLFKNIFAKPGRLIVIMICMIVACFAGFLALDLGSTLGEAFDDFGAKYVGGADYLIVYFGTEGITDALFEGTVPAQFVGKRAVKKREITRDEKLYNYAITDSVSLYSFSNPDAARQLKALRMETLPNDGEVAISKKYSEKYGYQIGDELVVYNSEEEAVPLTVVNIYDNEDYLGEMSGYINDNQCSELLGQYTYTAGILGVEDTDREEFEKFMEENHPNIVLTKAYLPESLQKLLTNITYVLYLVFVLVFVLVVFVTVSFVEKIVVERMSVIGTLRSIGMSMRKTTVILILENVIYGVAGSIIGFLLYLVLRGFILSKIGGAAGAAPDIGPVNPLKCLMVIVGAILIQILVPLAEILKAVKTSIRDIIFDTRDGEYKVSVWKTVLGFVLMIGGFILGFTIKSLPVSIASVLLLILGGALSIQFIVRALTLLLAKIFKRTNMPVAELASFETGSKKPNSSNAVLAIAAITASAAIFVLGSAVVTTVKRPVYDADVIIEASGLKTGKYEYLKETEDVSEVEYIYVTNDAVSINGDDYDVDVILLPKTEKYKQYGDLPAELKEDEVIFDIQKAKVLGLKEGDSVDLVFHNTGIFPRKKTLKVAGVTEYNRFLSTGAIILSEKLYNELYPDEVALILVGTDNPEKVKTEIENSLTNGETVMTRAEYLSDVREEGAEVTMIIIGVMAAAIGLQRGEFASLMGASGSGKSTLLYLCGGLDTDYEGDIYICGQKMTGMKEAEMSKLRLSKIGFIFQFYNLIQNLTVEENILLPIKMAGKNVPNYQDKLEEILEITGLTEKRNHKPSQLSGGQQQRVSIARAVLSEPEILLADEPTGNLDSKSTTEIMELFKRINEEKGITFLQVTHSIETAEYGNRIIRLDSGKLVG